MGRRFQRAVAPVQPQYPVQAPVQQQGPPVIEPDLTNTVPSMWMAQFAQQMAVICGGINQVEHAAAALSMDPNAPDDVLRALEEVVDVFEQGVDRLGLVLGELNNWQKGQEGMIE